MKKYVFKKYNPEYQKFFQIEKQKLLRILNTSTKIEHVGSTAIFELGGKGILDILIGVPKDEIQGTKKRLEKAGYEFREKAGTPTRLFFRRDYPYKRGKRRVHIHLTVFNSKDWKEIISFRDYLKEHPEAVEEYTKIKKEAVKKAKGEGEIYQKIKEDFIEKILKKVSK